MANAENPNPFEEAAREARGGGPGGPENTFERAAREAAGAGEGGPGSPDSILEADGSIKNGRFVLTKETARQVLGSPEYHKMNRREQAGIRRTAEVKSARRHLYNDPAREKPPTKVLSAYQDIYVKRIKDIRDAGVFDDINSVAGDEVVDLVRGKLKTKEDVIASIYEVLTTGAYLRKFALGSESFLQYALGRLKDDPEALASLSSWHDAIKGLVDFWEKSVKGKGGAGEGMQNMIADGTRKIPTEHIHLLLTDPRIEKAYHNASGRALDELRYKEKLVLTKSPGKKAEVKAVVEIDENGENIARDPDEVACDILGELLHGVTLKVRFDWRQTPQDYYIVYKNDQPGLQLSEYKYKHSQFPRLLRTDSKGKTSLVWNNGMLTLWTHANKGALVKRWEEFINEYDPENPFAQNAGYSDERGLAWLISYAGEKIDYRLLDFEAMHFEEWVELDSAERSRTFRLYFNAFKQDLAAGGERAARARHAIAANMSRMRTVWHPEMVNPDTGEMVDYSDVLPDCPQGVPINEQGFDLDAVRFNPQTREWEFSLNYSWFFQTRDNEAGSVLQEDISDIATYESYLINSYKPVYEMTQAGNFADFQNRPKQIDDLLAEDSGKELSAAVPQYRELLRMHLISQVVDQEMTALSVAERYRGRAMNFLKDVREKTFYLEWDLNYELHFKAPGIEGGWWKVNDSEMPRASPGKKLRVVMQENSSVEMWKHWARVANDEQDITLDQLLTFMGVRKINEHELIETKKQMLRDMYGADNVVPDDKKKEGKIVVGASDKEFLDKERAGEIPETINDKDRGDYLLLEYLNTRKVVDLRNTENKKIIRDEKRDKPTEGEWKKRMLEMLKTDWTNRKGEEKSLAEKLIRLGKFVSPYENGKWAYDLAITLRENPESQEDLDLAHELDRLRNTIPGTRDPNWTFLSPWHPIRLARKISWDFETDTEFYPDYDIAREHGKGENWYEAGGGAMMVNVLEGRKRVNTRTWRHLVPLGENRGRHLYRQWNDELGNKDYGTPLEGRHNQQISLIRDLWGGWWTYQAETGLQERSPFYVEKEQVFFTTSLVTAPYRMETAGRTADIAWRERMRLPKDAEVNRESGEWKELYEARLRENMIIAAGPDYLQGELAGLSFLGTLGMEGKGTLDEKPRDEFARWFGVETLKEPGGISANRYRDYLAHQLNILRFVPDMTQPEQREQVVKAIREQKGGMLDKDMTKLFLLGPEALEMAGFFGMNLQEMGQKIGETPVDNAAQFTNAIGAAITIPALYIGATLITGTVPFSSLFLALGTIASVPIGARIGWILGTDVGDKDSIQKVPVVKILGIELLKVKAGTIARWQERLMPIIALNPIGLPGYLFNATRGRLESWSSPVAVRRKTELMAGRGHETLLKSGFVVSAVDTWKEKFGD